MPPASPSEKGLSCWEERGLSLEMQGQRDLSGVTDLGPCVTSPSAEPPPAPLLAAGSRLPHKKILL